MSERTGKTMGRVAGMLGVAVLAGLLFSGCQTPGKVVSVGKCPACPVCKSETRTAPIKGMTYTQVVCPTCKKVRNTGTWAELADRTSVWVCDKCKMAVSQCEECAKKMKK